MKRKAILSAAVLAAIAAGAPATKIFDVFIHEKEGNTLEAVVDPGGVWSLCHGVTHINGKPVIKGQRVSARTCEKLNAMERAKALAWVDQNIHVPLSEPAKAGIASFCPYNIGPAKCFNSTFYRRINQGNFKGACEALRWWIMDGGRDCRKTKGQADGCYGQVTRRQQESALVCWGMED